MFTVSFGYSGIKESKIFSGQQENISAHEPITQNIGQKIGQLIGRNLLKAAV